MKDQPPVKAVENGHVLEWDPPFASAALRWTCTTCSATAIRYCRNEYGSATETQCTGGERDDD